MDVYCYLLASIIFRVFLDLMFCRVLCVQSPTTANVVNKVVISSNGIEAIDAVALNPRGVRISLGGSKCAVSQLILLSSNTFLK